MSQQGTVSSGHKSKLPEKLILTRSASPTSKWLLRPSLLLFLLIFAFTAFFGVLSIQQHRAFLTNGLDIGNVDQALWNTAQGRFLHFTLMAPIQSRLALHVEPVLLLFVPFYWLGLGNPELLLIAQAAIVALGSWPLYQLTIRHYQMVNNEPDTIIARVPGFMNYVALMMPLAYLLLPTLQSAVLFDFHAVTLAPTFLLFSVLALEQGKPGRFITFAILVMACKEDMPLVVAAVGLYAGLVHHRWRLAATVIGLSLIWFVVAFVVIQPQFAAGGNIQLDRYAWLGQDPVAMVRTLIFQPGLVFDHLWNKADLIAYLGQLFFPTAYIGLLSPLTLLPMLPTLAVNLLSENPFSWRLEDFHYGAPLAPFLFLSTLYGMRRIVAISTRKSGQKMRPVGRPDVDNTTPFLITLLTLLVLILSIIYHYHRGYTPLARPFNWPRITSHYRQLESLLATIPADTPVFTQPNLAPHLSQRVTIYNDFAYFTDPDFQTAAVPVKDIVLDITGFENIGGLHQYLRRSLLEGGRYDLIAARDGILHFRPASGSARSFSTELPASFYTFSQPDRPVDYALQVDFDQTLRLHGYTLHHNRQEELQVTLDLELLRPSSRLQPVLYLLDNKGRPLGATTDLQPTLVWFPIAQWPVGEVVRVHFNTLLWHTRQTPSYRLALGVIDGDDVWAIDLRQRPMVDSSTEFAVRLPAEGSLVELARIEQQWNIPDGGPSLRQYRAPILPNSDHINFSDQLLLLGYTDLSIGPKSQNPASSGSDDQMLFLTLNWRAIRNPEPLIRFVQLVGPDGLIYGQQDSVPVFGTYPTERWQPGEVVVDKVEFPVAARRPTGQFRLHVGLYRPLTGERLSIETGGDHIEIMVR